MKGRGVNQGHMPYKSSTRSQSPLTLGLFLLCHGAVGGQRTASPEDWRARAPLVHPTLVLAAPTTSLTTISHLMPNRFQVGFYSFICTYVVNIVDEKELKGWTTLRLRIITI